MEVQTDSHLSQVYLSNEALIHGEANPLTFPNYHLVAEKEICRKMDMPCHFAIALSFEKKLLPFSSI